MKQFDFHITTVTRSKDSYYLTDWSKAVPVVVRAETYEQAKEQIETIFGKPPDYEMRVFSLNKAIDAETADGLKERESE